MTREALVRQIFLKKSFLTIGLDSDIKKIPAHLHEFDDPVFEFNKQIIDSTVDVCVAYKINTAFYEARGSKGWDTLQKTAAYIPEDIFKIADAKRGDIGNTSGMYAEAFFKTLPFDAVTVAPYMGKDSVLPFLEYKDKWVILLGLTSNEGSGDFQMLNTGGDYLYKKVLSISERWGNADNMMYVIGATHPQKFAEIRQLLPNHFFLVPGVGAQGGNLAEVSRAGMNAECGLLINSSRGIIFAGNGKDFANRAREEALAVKLQMQALINATIPVTD